jgi:subtilisin family serine protease
MNQYHNSNLKLSLILTIGLMIAGCSQIPQIDTNLAGMEHLLTVDISSSDSRESLETRYGGARVVSYHPDDAYAILKLDAVQLRSLQAADLAATEPNADTINTPEGQVEALSVGKDSWMSGWSSWGSGWSTWGSGWSTWCTGGQDDLNNVPNADIFNRIRLSEALGLAPRKGTGVKVAVIDSGIDLNHPVFQSNLAPLSDWYDFVDNDSMPQEVSGSGSNKGYGHGTSVAGIVLQIAPKAQIMPLRVLNSDGKGDTDNVISAIDWAVTHGAKVINLSLGTVYLKSLEKIIDTATKAGVFVVASSGNSNNQSVTYPASAMDISGSWGEMSVSVGSSDTQDKKSSFSTYGSIEMTAIGDKVFSPAPGNRAAKWSGTSMAAPMVSGGFALALGERKYSAAELRKIGKAMYLSTDDIEPNNPSFINQLGDGRLDLENFLNWALASKIK